MAEIVVVPTVAELNLIARDLIEGTYADIVGPLADLFPIVAEDVVPGDDWFVSGEFAGARTDRESGVLDEVVKLAGRLANRMVHELTRMLLDSGSGAGPISLAMARAIPDDEGGPIDFGAGSLIMAGDVDCGRLADGWGDEGPALGLFKGGRFVGSVASGRTLNGPPVPAGVGDTGFSPWLPAGTMLRVGRPRDGSPAGRVMLGRNANRTDCGPGLHAAAVFRGPRGPIEVHLGANLKVVLDHPDAVAIVIG